MLAIIVSMALLKLSYNSLVNMFFFLSSATYLGNVHMKTTVEAHFQSLESFKSMVQVSEKCQNKSQETEESLHYKSAIII